MAEPISIQQLKDASLDVKSLEEVVNGDENVVVTTRLGETYPSVKGSIKKVFENGGLPATPFKTKALMTASALVDGDYAMVIDETANNGLYVKTEGTWVKSSYDPLAQAKSYTRSKAKAHIMPLVSSNINYLSASGSLVFSNTVNIVSPDRSFAITTPVTLVFPSNGSYRIEANSSSKTIRAVSIVEPYEEGWETAAYVTRTIKGLETTDITGFLVDGVLPELKIDETFKADFQSESMNINTATRTLELKSQGFAYTSQSRISVPIQTVTYPSTGSIHYFLVEKTTRVITYALPSEVYGLLNSRNYYLLFWFDSNAKKLYGYTGAYTVDNKVDGDSLRNKTNYSLITTSSSALNFDFINNKISVTGSLFLPYDGGRLLVSTQDVALDVDRNRGYSCSLLVNPNDSKLVVVPQAAGYSIPKDHIVIGSFNERDKRFMGITYFSVNGEPFNEVKNEARLAFGWSVNNELSINVEDSYTPSDTLNLSNLTSSKIYALYDALVAAYPDYVTKTLLGNDASGTIPIYQYRFKPKLPTPKTSPAQPKLPKVLLLSLHNEGINFIYVYTLLREICNSWVGNEALTSLRHGVEFVVIPVLNPWGLDNAQRTNSNGVDINRNFPTDWIKLGSLGDYAYSGEAALSESESQIGYAAMLAEKADIYLDCHSFGSWNTDGRTLWVSIKDDRALSAATSASTKIYAQYKQEFPWLVDIDALTYFTDSNVNDGGVSSKTAQALGAVGGNLEIAWNLKNEPSGLTGHTSAINFATDFIGTLILQYLGVLIAK